MAHPDVLVIGAGVSGLSTAVTLAEAGRTVRIIAELPPAKTTSAAAGASWGPYMVEDQRVLRWSSVTRIALEEIAADPRTGVRLVEGVEAAAESADPPDWALEVPGFRVCRQDELAALPSKYVSAWRYTIPLVDMPTYLDYLEKRLTDAGGRIDIGIVSSLTEVAGQAGVLVNCTGFGAKALVPDPGMSAIRGQLVVVENPGIDEFFQDDGHGENLTYILPHGDHVVLGGCATDPDDDLERDPETTKRMIIKRCAEIEPKLWDAQVITTREGLRPTRAEVRTERVDLNGVPLIHNYGHGGAGLTLSWGCAKEVQRLIG